MESWSSYVPEEKGLRSSEVASSTDSLARNTNMLMGWHVKAPDYDNNLPVSGQLVRENRGVVGEIGSPAESSAPSKKSRSMNLKPQIFLCQVHNCNKNLSSCKDYHKRHRVCEVHSKTPKVIVNGIEQRFCQQCSRFHLLVEFDDGKRSCRKRLAGHNERRRKPQLGSHSGRNGRFQSYNGSTSDGTSLRKTSFVCQDLFSSGLLHAEKYGTNEWCRRVKLKLGNDYSPPSVTDLTAGCLHSKSPFPDFGLGKQHSDFVNGGTSGLTGSILTEEGSLYSNMSGPNTFFQDTSLGRDHYNAFDSASTIQGFSTITRSGALSLLSSHPQNSSSHSSGIPIAQPLNIADSHASYSLSQVIEKFPGVRSQPSVSGLSNKFSPSMDVGVGHHLGPMLASESNDAINFEIAEGFFRELDFDSGKDRLPCEDGPTIDLFQLSSHLQRVERQRQSMQVKQEKDAFCSLRIT